VAQADDEDCWIFHPPGDSHEELRAGEGEAEEEPLDSCLAVVRRLRSSPPIHTRQPQAPNTPRKLTDDDNGQVKFRTHITRCLDRSDEGTAYIGRNESHINFAVLF
jgi:hypothetical protein